MTVAMDSATIPSKKRMSLVRFTDEGGPVCSQAVRTIAVSNSWREARARISLALVEQQMIV